MPRDAPPPITEIPTHEWQSRPVLDACRARDANALLRLAHKYGVTNERLSYWTGIYPNEISRRLNGKLTSPVEKLDRWERIADALAMPPHARLAVGLAPDAVVIPAPAAIPSTTPGEKDPAPTSMEAVTASRREALQLGGAAIASTLLDHLWSEPDLWHDALDHGSASATRLDAIRSEALDLGVRVVHLPPAALLGEALGRFRTVRRLAAKKQRLADQRDLVISGGMFATIVGEIMFNLGEFRMAAHWYSAAQRSAREAGDQYLADIALAGSTYLPTYTPDPRGVLGNVVPRLDARYSPSPATAWLWGFRAKAHAQLGDEVEFQRAVARAQYDLNQSAADLIRPGIFSFLPEKLAFYEARGWVELGNAEKASSAAERALGMYDFRETTEPALVRFEQASALARAGERAEACRIAADAVLDGRTYHGVTIVTRAREFDQMLGSGNDQPVRQWREILASVRRPRLALTSGENV